MKQTDLLKKLAKLETINDQLAAELHALGFADGLKTLKSAALEMLETDQKKQEGKSIAKDNPGAEESDY